MSNKNENPQLDGFRKQIQSMTPEELIALATVLKRRASDYLEEVQIVEEQLSRKKGKRDASNLAPYVSNILFSDDSEFTFYLGDGKLYAA